MPVRLLMPVGRSWVSLRVCRFDVSLPGRHGWVWCLPEARLVLPSARRVGRLVVVQVVLGVEGRRVVVGAVEAGSVGSRLHMRDSAVGIRAAAYHSAVGVEGRCC